MAASDPGPTRADITGIVLAGGLGRRMSSDGQGTDKGLRTFHGEPMVAHVIARLRPQVGAILVNANRNLERYASFGHPVVPDRLGGFVGPLAGLHAGLSAATSDWVVTVPCDSPFLPIDLVERLAARLRERGGDIAVARTGAQAQPVFALVRRSLLADLERFLGTGQRKIDAWYAPLALQEVDFPDSEPFVNINTSDELERLEASREPPPVPAARASGSPSLSDVVRGLPDYDPDALAVTTAQAVIERFVVPVTGWERCTLRDAPGRVLAADLPSPIDVPAHDNSAMDGFALRSSDLAASGDTVLEIAGAAFAGRPFDGSCGPGQAIRITTGAVMPAGTDTVVVQEVAKADGTRLTVPAGQVAGQNRRLRGEDLQAGRAALRAGRTLTAADVGLAASLGVGELTVRRRLRVAMFSTGDEVRSIGEPLGPGQIYDSNRYTIHAMLRRIGAEPIDMGVIPDDPQALESAMREAAGCADAIVSSGGVSVGEADFTRAVMARLGDVTFWKIAMRPGRPMALGRIGDAYYFGLPGNPVAVMITFYFFARRALLRLAGASDAEPLMLRARSTGAIRKKPGRTEYQRAIAWRGDDGELQVRLTGSQGSGVLRSMAEANVIMVLDHARGDVAAGDWVDCLPFSGLS